MSLQSICGSTTFNNMQLECDILLYLINRCKTRLECYERILIICPHLEIISPIPFQKINFNNIVFIYAIVLIGGVARRGELWGHPW